MSINRCDLRAVAAVIVTIVPAVLLVRIEPEPAIKTDAKGDGPVQTSICGLAQHPGQFDGKIVQVCGIVLTGTEGSVLMDESCLASVQFRFSSAEAPAKDEYEVAFITNRGEADYPERLRWHVPEQRNTIPVNEDDAYHRLDEFVNQRSRECWGSPSWRITVTFTGRFDHAPTRWAAVRRIGSQSIHVVPAGFGMLMASSELVVQSVSEPVLEHLLPYEPRKQAEP